MRRLGLLLSISAVAASGPRLVLLFLSADRIDLGATWTRALLGLSGVPTAVVMTLGACYLGHCSVKSRSVVLGLSTVLVLASTAALLAPLLVAQLGAQQIHDVLSTSNERWLWSVLAVLAPDLVAVLCAIASSEAGSEAGREQDPERTTSLGVDGMSLTGSWAVAKPAALRRRVAHRTPAEQPARPSTAAVITPSGDIAAEFTCSRCGRTSFRSRKAIAGHQRSCKLRPQEISVSP